MLRLFVLALLLANGAYFAWSHGLMRGLGLAPHDPSESQRLAQQLRPESLRVLTPDEARRLEAAPATPVPVPMPVQPVSALECLQAGLFDVPQAEVLRGKLLSSLPVGAWLLEPAVEPARWIVYMGPYPSAQALARKRSELASLNLRFEPLTNSALEYGVSLGLHQTQAAANAQLANLTRRGVRTARVVQERAEVRGTVLKIPAADDAVKARLEAFEPALAGKPLRPCRQ